MAVRVVRYLAIGIYHVVCDVLYDVDIYRHTRDTTNAMWRLRQMNCESKSVWHGAPRSTVHELNWYSKILALYYFRTNEQIWTVGNGGQKLMFSSAGGERERVLNNNHFISSIIIIYKLSMRFQFCVERNARREWEADRCHMLHGTLVPRMHAVPVSINLVGRVHFMAISLMRPCDH